MISEFRCIVPDGALGDWRVETFEVSEREASFSRIRSSIGHSLEEVKAGKYKRLMRKNTVVMSDTQMEFNTNRAIIRAAKGHVLINGLGLGLVVDAIMRKPEVTKVTVVEKSVEVIQLVAPTFNSNPKFNIVQGDALTYRPSKLARFDAVWHDIWDYICGDNVKEMRRLKRKYEDLADWQGCWCERECLRANL